MGENNEQLELNAIELTESRQDTSPDVVLPPQARSRWSPRRTVGVMLLFVVAALFALKTGAFTKESTDSPDAITQSVLPVSTVFLEPESSYAVARTYTGEIQARRASNLGLELTGTLINIAVEEGDRVQKGMILAQLDTRSINAQKKQLLAQKAQAFAQLKELRKGPRTEEIEAARATVADLKQQYALAQRQSLRRKELYEKGAVSREAYDERFFNAEALKQRQQQAQKRLDQLLAGTRSEQVESQDAQLLEIDARIEALEIQRTKSVLIAPFSGRVAQRLVDEGVVLNAGQPIIRLVEAGLMEARIGVPQAVADTLRIGDRYPIQLDSASYSGRVSAFLPEVDSQSRTVTVVLEFQPNAALSLGQTAKLTIQQAQSAQGYWLPSTAITAGKRGLWSAYVLKKPATAQDHSTAFTVARRDVEVIHTEGDRVFVRGMLSPGEQVIQSGTHRLATGQLVQPIAPK